MPLKRDFVDVKINPAPTTGSSASTAGEVCFALTGTPDKAWGGFFTHLWNGEANNYPARCPVRVVRDMVALTASAEDVATLHLERLRRAIDEANATYRSFLSREMAILDSIPNEAAEAAPVDTRATLR